MKDCERKNVFLEMNQTSFKCFYPMQILYVAIFPVTFREISLTHPPAKPTTPHSFTKHEPDRSTITASLRASACGRHHL